MKITAIRGVLMAFRAAQNPHLGEAMIPASTSCFFDEGLLLFVFVANACTHFSLSSLSPIAFLRSVTPFSLASQ